MKNILAEDLLKKGESQPPKEVMAELAGAQLQLLEWGDPSRPGLLFLHGGAAHSGWWRFIAPFFLPDYHCIAVDFSGHGDSARRTNYTPAMWADEVLALTSERSIFATPPIIIGHSMGGLIGIRVAAVLAEKLPGLVIIDSAVRPRQLNHQGEGNVKKINGSNLLGRKRIYNSRQQALSRFRLIPPQDCKNEMLVKFIAAESIRQTDDGWTWKYDPKAFRDLQPTSIFDELKTIVCQTAIIYGQSSRILDRETALKMRAEIQNAIDIIEISDAHHHLMLDEPVVLIQELQRILKYFTSNL